MGCDIHLFTEVRDADGKWELFACDDPHRPGEQGYTDRCYAVFATLADVRNDREPIKPISKPRGWPEDMSDDLRALVNDETGRFRLRDVNEWPGDHSASYLTLAEILAHEWSRIEGYDYAARFLAFCDELGKHGPPDDVRIVFNFDS